MICHIRFFLPRKMWKQRNGAFRANHDEHRTCIRIKLTFLYDFYDLEIVRYYDITYILVMDTTISKFTLQDRSIYLDSLMRQDDSLFKMVGQDTFDFWGQGFLPGLTVKCLLQWLDTSYLSLMIFKIMVDNHAWKQSLSLKKGHFHIVHLKVACECIQK